MPDPLIVSRVGAYMKAMEDRFRLYIEDLFFPEVDGYRQPIFTEKLDDQTEYLKLQETKRAAELVVAGQMEPNFETDAWLQNKDGAHERLMELQQKFEEQRNA